MTTTLPAPQVAATETPAETWKDIDGFPGYQVSDQGRVRSRKSGEWMVLKNIVCPRWGYHKVHLCNQDGVSTFTVHRLVLAAFVGPGGELIGRHLNDNRDDNTLTNLAYGSQQDNMDDKARNGRQPQGERNGRAVLTADGVREIRRLRQGGVSRKTVAERFGVAEVTIKKITSGRLWSHVQ